MIYDFNLDNDLDIKPAARSEEHFTFVHCCTYNLAI